MFFRHRINDMKKLALATAAMLNLLSIAGCAQYVAGAKPRRQWSQRLSYGTGT
jgi:hypothetical protein